MVGSCWTRGLAVVWAGAIAACGGGGGGQESEPAQGDETAPGAAAEAVDPAVAATITGTVMFEGEVPAATEIDMSEEPVCAAKHTEGTPTTEELVVSGGRLANVFVYVREGLAREAPAAEGSVTLDQNGCQYRPHVLGLQVGQTLLIRNSDAVLHNINTQPTVNRGFNISQPQAGMESRRDFSRPEVMIPVKCDVHGWMRAYIGVVNHPYHAVSSSDGTFEIAALPPGTYVVEAWHELYGTASQDVTVGDAGTADITFTFTADMAGRDVPLGTPLIVGAHGTDHGAAAAVAGAGR